MKRGGSGRAGNPGNTGGSGGGRPAVRNPRGGRLRLSGGRYGGRFIAVPPEVRPTEARVREALMSIWGERLEGARVLDLFAGSGAVALEALGRGAGSATAVERDPRAAAALEANSAALGESGGLRVIAGALPLELARLAHREPAGFDLVFADPPYSFTGHAALLSGLEPLLAEGGEAVIEHSARSETPLEAGRLVRVDRRRYGESGLSFYRRGGSPEPV